jgi:hypothetical protein
MRVMYTKVRARSANEGSGTTGWLLAVPVPACFLVDKEDFPLHGSLNNRGVVVHKGNPERSDEQKLLRKASLWLRHFAMQATLFVSQRPSWAAVAVPLLYNRFAVKIPRGIHGKSERTSIVSELKAERTSLASQLKQVDTALMALRKLDGRSSRTKTGHAMSAAGRKRISLAQKKRWARVRAQNVVSITSKRAKRKLSAAGRRRIAAAVRARWAKFRAAKK